MGYPERTRQTHLVNKRNSVLSVVRYNLRYQSLFVRIQVFECQSRSPERNLDIMSPTLTRAISGASQIIQHLGVTHNVREKSRGLQKSYLLLSSRQHRLFREAP